MLCCVVLSVLCCFVLCYCLLSFGSWVDFWSFWEGLGSIFGCLGGSWGVFWGILGGLLGSWRGLGRLLGRLGLLGSF